MLTVPFPEMPASSMALLQTYAEVAGGLDRRARRRGLLRHLAARRETIDRFFSPNLATLAAGKPRRQYQ
jgi:hypothetical protein